MKKIYEAAEINIFLFANPDIIVASSVTEESFVPHATLEENETEIL